MVPHKDVTGLVDKLKTQKGIVIEQKVIPGANHFLICKVEPPMRWHGYLDKRLKIERKPSGLRAAAAPSAMVCGHDPVVPVRRGRPEPQPDFRTSTGERPGTPVWWER